MMGTMNMGVLVALLFGFPFMGPGMGWKSEKMAFFSGWHGVLAFDEAML